MKRAVFKGGLPLLRALINLTPFIPLSLKGEGEEILERGFHPSLMYTPLPLLREGGGGIGY
jgi:hypothetical protein